MAAEVSQIKTSSWVVLRQELKRRTLEPASHASFVLYFVVAVILAGGAGIWLELHSYIFNASSADQPHTAGALRTAVITFFPALAGSSCMQLIWAENDKKSLRAFSIFIMAALLLLVFLTAPPSLSSPHALWIGGIASVIALWTWWIANANQTDLLDPDVAVGNRDPKTPLPGTLDGFTV